MSIPYKNSLQKQYLNKLRNKEVGLDFNSCLKRNTIIICLAIQHPVLASLNPDICLGNLLRILKQTHYSILVVDFSHSDSMLRGYFISVNNYQFIYVCATFFVFVSLCFSSSEAEYVSFQH